MPSRRWLSYRTGVVLWPEDKCDRVTRTGGNIRGVIDKFAFISHNDLMVCCRMVACRCRVARVVHRRVVHRRVGRVGHCRVAIFRQLLECTESLVAGGRRVDSEHHALRTMTGLTTVSPYRLGVIDCDLECRVSACGIRIDGSTVEVY